MSDDPLYVGVHWAGDGWVAVAFDRTAFDHAAVFDGVGGAWHRYEETAERLLVDVPIGLVEEGDRTRRCDDMARELLGDRGSAVVRPPVRAATRRRRYPAAKRVSERKGGTDLSRAAFELSDGIAPVDELLQNVPEARPVVAGSHPAVCFRAFAGEPLAHDRDRAAGYAERMRALATFDRDAPPAVQAAAEATAGHAVTVADVLDATALAYTARPGPGSLRSLPPDPPTDPEGLPMRIVYRAEQPPGGA
ncbi:DUF429 domain-containing protein [Halobacteriales archaeon QS_1_68_17]|nr:MAG: DUF429 domain-containing protein [Halobacteriales archaeon QS_1_68_17]